MGTIGSLFIDGYFVILTYYLGMVMWSGFIYLYRNTFQMITQMKLEYKYDNGDINYLTDDMKKLINKFTTNMFLMVIVNVSASIFCLLYLFLMGIKLFILISIPLYLLILCLYLLMGIYNNKMNKDVHKVETLLG